jgi:uncharacterized damage-inducible protein DinB
MGTVKKLVAVMYGHSVWANQQLLNAAEQLTPEELRQPVPGGQGSILDILVHMMGAQLGWTRRFQQLDPVKPPEAADYPDIAALRAAWAEIDAGTDAFIAAMADDDLDEFIRFRSWYGWERESPRWQAVLHQAFHQHQHRGEVAAALTALGHSPGELDIFDYLEAVPYGTPGAN